MYADLGDLDYFISGNMDNALLNYTKATKNEYDNASVNYKIGFIQYAKKDYEQALSAFIKSTYNTEIILLLYADYLINLLWKQVAAFQSQSFFILTFYTLIYK